jgi:hypothetical protein
MLQRIQTVYLLIVTILTGLMLFLPLAEILNDGGDVLTMYSYGLVNQASDKSGVIYSTLPMAIMIAIIFTISAISIFLYKNRIRQMRFCVFNILLMVGLLGLILFYYLSVKKDIGVSHHTFRLPVVLPIINIVLTFQAFRGIRRDELLVRSYERLR